MHKICSKTIRLFLTSGVLLLLGSCGNAYYVAKAPTIPMLEEKGNFCASFGAQLTPATLLFGYGALTMDAAYAVSDHWAVQAAGQICDDQEDYYLQASAICYLPIREHQELELWAGAGKGLSIAGKELTSEHSYTTRFHNQQYYALASYGWHNLTRAHIDCGVGLRGGCMPFHLTSVSNHTGEVEADQDFVAPFFEPQVFFRIGPEHVRFQLQINYTNLSTYFSRKEVARVVSSPLMFSAGVTLHL